MRHDADDGSVWHGTPDPRLPGSSVLGLGVISNKNYVIETPQEVAASIRKALQYVQPERVQLNSDCGLSASARPAAKANLRAMATGADVVRQEVKPRVLVVTA